MGNTFHSVGGVVIMFVRFSKSCEVIVLHRIHAQKVYFVLVPRCYDNQDCFAMFGGCTYTMRDCYRKTHIC